MSSAIAEPKDLARVGQDDDIMRDTDLWDIVSSGDLKGLGPEQRARYYLLRCRQEGLNPASQPFTYLLLNGKGVLYGNKTAADQLRKLHGISIVKVECTDDGEYITYEVTVGDREGRQDFELGSVWAGGAKGEQRANLKMKALTKAKRRATYSICGTGVLDETEVDAAPSVPAGVPEAMGWPAGVTVETIARRSDEIGIDRADAETSQPLTLDDDIRRLRASLGWSADDVISEARTATPPINLRTSVGKRAMVDRLQSYVGAVAADDPPPDDRQSRHEPEPEDEDELGQGGFIDAPSRVEGSAGNDAWTAGGARQ